MASLKAIKSARDRLSYMIDKHTIGGSGSQPDKYEQAYDYMTACLVMAQAKHIAELEDERDHYKRVATDPTAQLGDCSYADCDNRTHEPCKKCEFQDQCILMEDCDKAEAQVKGLKEQNRRLVEAWKELTSETYTTGSPLQVLNGKPVFTELSYGQLPHGPEEPYCDDDAGEGE